jgi:adenylate kinase family enzyme
LRSHVRDGTDLGMKAKQYMDDGKLVPDQLMIDLVMNEATPHLDNGKSLLLDGFPRTVTQAQALEEVVHVDMVINLDVPTETIVERIADRCVVREDHQLCYVVKRTMLTISLFRFLLFAGGFMNHRDASTRTRTNHPRFLGKMT